ERFIQMIGGAVSPGLIAKMAQAAGIAPEVIPKLLPWLTQGVKRDVLMGATSFGGAEVAHTIAPNSAIAPVVGAVAAPLTVAALHAGLSKGLQYAGKGIAAEQDAAQAERELASVRKSGETMVRQRQEGVTQAERELAATKEAGGLQTG